jgi:diguanylate cyclase (GGDEF)-like protein
MSRRPLVERRATSRALALYTGGAIVAGFVALVWATIAVPLWPAIAADGLARLSPDPRVAGLLFWIALGLFGSARTRSLGGHAVLTFHLPFIVAAMTLGGPAAGAWVAAISSIELREIREVPWFGTLSNHAILALAGVLGGLAYGAIHTALGSIVDPQLAIFAAAAGAAIVFCAVDVGMAAITVGLREHLKPDELAAVFDGSFRQTTAGEVVLGWLLAAAYVAVAWWAPIVCTILVLLVWRANDEHEESTHDALTGLLNRRGFDVRYAPILRRVRLGRQRAALVMVDLDRFKAVNDTLGHAAGDEVLRQTARRLKGAVRYTDVTARLGGDEFVLLLGGLPDRKAAERVVRRVHKQLCEPLVIGSQTVSIGASLGLVFLDDESPPDALENADRAMYHAKQGGGGVTLASTA